MRVLTVLAIAFMAIAITPVPGLAIDQSKGHPGFCQSGTGVTVVVDFQQLGGTTIVRCNPQSTRGTGLDALKGAGFQINGLQGQGEAFVCRIENRPSAEEALPIKGRDGYRESCVGTPPAAGYWSYWSAGNNCQWTYSSWGAKNRDFIPGGFEGWSFSLNATADTNPKPRVAAVRPGTQDVPCAAKEEPKPATGDPHEQQRGAPDQGAGPAGPGSDGGQQGGGNAGGTAPTGGANSPAPGTGTTATPGALPPPKPRPVAQPADDPATNVEFTGGEAAADVNAVVKEQSGASDYAPWVAAGVIALLGLAALLTAQRRKRARDS